MSVAPSSAAAGQTGLVLLLQTLLPGVSKSAVEINHSLKLYVLCYTLFFFGLFPIYLPVIRYMILQ